jgi:hypothetical protein
MDFVLKIQNDIMGNESANFTKIQIRTKAECIKKFAASFPTFYLKALSS